MMVLLECTANDLKDENGAFKKWHRSIQINVPTCIYPEEFKIQFLTDNYTNFALFIIQQFSVTLILNSIQNAFPGQISFLFTTVSVCFK